MRLLPFYATLAGISLLAPLAAVPSVLWSVPSDAKESSTYEEMHLAWLNDDELIAVRRGALAGRYHCGPKTKLWEKRLPGISGFASSPRALYVVRQDPGRVLEAVLEELDPRDGTVKQTWTAAVLGGAAKAEEMLLSEVAWLPKDGMLAVESLSSPGSKVWLFEPRKGEFKGSSRFKSHMNHPSAAGDRLVWLDGAGVIRWAQPGVGVEAEVWDTGLGEGGDDYPSMLAYEVGADGGFVAVLDNGGWLHGARLFSRQGLHGKVVEVPLTRDLQAVGIDLPRGRIWATEQKTGWFGVFDLSGKIVGETEKLMPPFCWAIQVAPSGKRAAVVDDEGTLWIIDGP